VSAVRHGKLTLDAARLRGVRPGRYMLVVKIGATVVRQPVRVDRT
jgi:hypothetical protein